MLFKFVDSGSKEENLEVFTQPFSMDADTVST